MKKSFYSHGKLLITGEYLVLDGAQSLALPTKFGQDLIVEEGMGQEIKWKSFDADGSIWFEGTISFSALKKKVLFGQESIQTTLQNILHEAYLLNPKIIDHSEGYTITTHLTFPKKWGLGTSSTLINNIAQWFKIDAFVLLKKSFGGSGYDIACAQNDSPILYHLEQKKPIIKKVNFKPPFTENVYFVYLNQKQNSKAAIAFYHKNKSNSETNTKSINEITQAVLKTDNLNTFAELLKKHEKEMSILLGIKTVKETLFPDFKGTIKSLGAWGGDFVLVLSKDNPIPYFISKGYETIIPYQEMILESNH